MLNQLKSKLERSLEQFEALMDKLEDQFDDLDESGEVLWQKTQMHMRKAASRIERANELAAQALSIKAEETELQLHLATMDAHDQWQNLEGALGLFSQKLQSGVNAELDHARVQAHLAKLDASDVVSAQTEQIRHDFSVSKSKVAKEVLAAASKLQQQFSGVIDGLPK